MTEYEKPIGILVKLKITIFQIAKHNHTGYYFTMMLESIRTV